MDHNPEPDQPKDVEAELEALLAEAESTVSRLRRELAQARAREPRHTQTSTEIAEQHAEVEQLRMHLARAQVHWGEVRAFFEEALRGLRGPDAGADDDDA